MKIKYKLDKYSIAKRLGRDQKIICPRCGKKTFVRYVDEKNNIISDNYGKCDREVKCGYINKPININNMETNVIKTEIKKMKLLTIDANLMHQTLKCYDKNNLFKFLCSKFNANDVENIFRKYNVGTAKDGSAIYWQVDELGNVRTGKIMQYDADTGKRVKKADGTSQINWVHTKIKYNQNEFEMRQAVCFGAHLLKIKKYSKIKIVESEKTAIIMSLVEYKEDELWVAVGGKNMLNAAKVEYIAQFANDILIYPDIDAFEDWKKNLPILYQNKIEEWWKYYNGEGVSDIADYFVYLNKAIKNDYVFVEFEGETYATKVKKGEDYRGVCIDGNLYVFPISHLKKYIAEKL